MGISQQIGASSLIKVCNYCTKEKELDKFSPNSTNKYGVSNRCKECSAIVSRKYRAENSEHYRRLKREARLRNPQRSRKENAARYKKNPEAEKARYKKYCETHKHQIIEYGRRRRTRLLGALTFVIPPREWERLCLRYDNCCAYCGKKEKLTMDHIIPLSRGGYHGIGNLLPSCTSCNSSKNSKFIIEWRAICGN